MADPVEALAAAHCPACVGWAPSTSGPVVPCPGFDVVPTGDAGLDVEALSIVKRTASMGGCSQTHHQHLAADAMRLRARLSSSDTGEPTAQQRSLAEQHERGIHTVPEAWPGCPLCSSSVGR